MAEYSSSNGGKPNFVQLYASVGLMLDMERNVQLYHSWRVAAVAYHLARRLASFEAPFVFIAGLLADCGAIRFRRHIVHELTDAPAVLGQKSQIHLFFHPLAGYEALRRLPGLREVAFLVRHHHEAVNGSGYPGGLKGEEIDMGAQILRLADQVDLTIRADLCETLDDVMLNLHPLVDEDYSESLVKSLEDLLRSDLPFGNLLQPEKITEEVEVICRELDGLDLVGGVHDWGKTLAGLGEMIDSRNDLYSKGHSTRTAEMVMRIADEMKLSDEDRTLAVWGAYLQNMGEVALRRSLLGKSDRLEDSEVQLIRYHPVVGSDLLGRVRNMSDVATVVRYHHENWDGSGYPEGLKGDAIPRPARIVRVADALDAMTSDRPYQRRKEWKQALKEIRRYAGSHFDPKVVEAVLDLLG